MRLLFHAGTLIIDGLDAHAGRRDFPIVTEHFQWDPRVDKWRAPASEHTAILRRWRAAGVAIEDDAARFGTLTGAVTENNPLRPYQRDALAAWAVARGRGIVVLPTGAGKTRLAVGAIARAARATLCIVPTRVLLAQWLKVLKAHYSGPIGVLGDGQARIEALTVATFESAYRRMQDIGSRFALLIVDEAHHFGQGQRDELFMMSLAPYRLGLSATIDREASSFARLATFLGPVVYEASLRELSGNYLAEFTHHLLSCELTAAERQAYGADMDRFKHALSTFLALNPGAVANDFFRAAPRSEEGRAALAALRRARSVTAYSVHKRRLLSALLARHAKDRTLVFTADNDSAYAIAREHLLHPFTCDIGRAERRDVLARFAAGEVNGIVSAQVLNEGLDVAEAEIAIIVGASLGAREHIQRIGRLLRPSLGKQPVVYEMVCRNTSEMFRSRERNRALEARPSTL